MIPKKKLDARRYHTPRGPIAEFSCTVCDEVWDEDIREFIAKAEEDWLGWLEQGEINAKELQVLRRKNALNRLKNEFKERGRIRCYCEKCRKK